MVVLAEIGVILSVLNLEALLLIITETPMYKRMKKRIKHSLKHWWWKNFNWTSDFKED